jgi:hypothetical protein
MRHRILLATVGLVVAVLAVVFHAPLAGLIGGSVAVFGMAIPNEDYSDIIRQMVPWRLCDPMGGALRRVIAKTADYTILDPYTATGGDASGTIFTNRGAAGTVNFTLPAPVPRLAGVYYDFVTIVAQIMLVLTATTDTLIADNDATADSLATTARIGVRLRVVCDGTSWVAIHASAVPQAAFAQTGTVAT